MILFLQMPVEQYSGSRKDRISSHTSVLRFSVFLEGLKTSANRRRLRP